MTEFNPNDLDPREYKWGTFIPDRRPRWKTHSNVGKAKNALTYTRREARLYELVDGKWICRVDLSDIPQCADCGGPVGKYYARTKWKGMTLLYTCGDCLRREREAKENRCPACGQIRR